MYVTRAPMPLITKHRLRLNSRGPVKTLDLNRVSPACLGPIQPRPSTRSLQYPSQESPPARSFSRQKLAGPR